MRQVGVKYRSFRPARQAPGPQPTATSSASPPIPTVDIDRLLSAGARPRRRGLSPLSRLGLSALAGIVAFAIVTGGGRQMRQIQPARDMIDNVALSLGLGIGQVEIVGNKYTSEAAITDTLDLANVHSLLRLDSAAVRQRIERLPWVETASVARVFPDQIRVTVTERKPFARWQNGDRTFLIDRTGRVLTPISGGTADDLPLLKGFGAPEAAAAIVALLEPYPSLNQRLLSAERVDGRRWNLNIADGPTVLLPAEGEAAALERLNREGILQRVAAMSGSQLDLRIADRMIVGRGEAVTGPELPRALQMQPDARPAAPAAKEKQSAQRG